MYALELAESRFPAQHDDVVLDTTIGGVLRAAARTRGDAECLVEARADGGSGRRWTYAALLAEAERLADALASRFAPGERVAVWAPNAPEWVLLEFAAGIAGLTLVTVNPAYQAKELAFVLAQSRSVALFLVREHRGNPMAAIAREVCTELPAIRAIVDLEDPRGLFARGDLPAAARDVAPDDPAQVQYTSGTTGFPKGAVLSHRGLTNNARFSLARLGVAPGTSYLNMMPRFHTAGCALGVLGSAQCGARMVLARQFDPAAVLRAIEAERVEALIGVPTMLIAMLDAQARAPRDCASLRAVLSGGSMVPPELVQRIEQTFGCRFDIIYGQTETCPGITQTRATDGWTERTQTIGQPYPQTEVSIREVGTNAVTPIGAIGEICTRGYHCMLGYTDDPQATARAIDADGWLHTGDLGTMDARGYVRITGRVKDMIIRGGENLFPAEIENVLIAHPAVAEVAVVGAPDPFWGEIAVAFLRARDGAALDVSDLVRHVRAELAAPKTPARWFALDAFPLTGSGKVQKFVLRERLLAGAYGARELH